MLLERDYKSLEDTLRLLKRQVIDSLPYMDEYIPDSITTPEKLFYYLRGNTTYKNDPVGVEHLQMVPTLFARGGKGDCDCFTILSLASQYHLGFLPQYVDLVGKRISKPSHIYTSVFDKTKNKVCVFDLTNPYYDYERSYNYHQRLKFSI